jgi:hypothetical protein
MLGIRRMTFLLYEAGRIQRIWSTVKPTGMPRRSWQQSKAGKAEEAKTEGRTRCATPLRTGEVVNGPARMDTLPD